MDEMNETIMKKIILMEKFLNDMEKEMDNKYAEYYRVLCEGLSDEVTYYCDSSEQRMCRLQAINNEIQKIKNIEDDYNMIFKDLKNQVDIFLTNIKNHHEEAKLKLKQREAILLHKVKSTEE